MIINLNVTTTAQANRALAVSGFIMAIALNHPN